MDIREFSYILAIVEHGSFTKAANSLYISQPSLSLYIKNMERRLGFAFFNRTNRKLVLTEEGRVYVEYARKIMELNNDMIEELERLAVRRKIYCRVGLTMTRSMDLMPLFMSRMQERYPGICVEVVVSKTNDLINSVLNQELDFILINKAFENNDLEYVSLYEDQMVIAVNRKNPVRQHADKAPGADLRSIDMKSLVHEPVITFQAGNWQRRMMEYLFSMQDAAPNIICETNNHLSALAHVKAGLGIATLVKSGIRRFVDDDALEFLSVQNEYPGIEFVIAYLKNRAMSDTARSAVHVIEEIVRTSYKEEKERMD